MCMAEGDQGINMCVCVCVCGGGGGGGHVCGVRTKYYLCVWEEEKELIHVCEGSRI